MRGILTICCAVAVALAVWSSAAPRPDPAVLVLAPAPDGLRGPVRVIDGDTFDLGGVRIRLQGVDAPERAETCRDARGRDWHCGAWATERVREMIGARPLECRDLGERNRNRVIAACLLDGQDLGARLLAEGIVRACPRYARRHAHSRGYEAVEARAIAARRGLHQGRSPDRAAYCQPRPGA